MIQFLLDCLFVASCAVRDLLLCAKHLFVAAIAGGDAASLAAVRSAAQVRCRRRSRTHRRKKAPAVGAGVSVHELVFAKSWRRES
jgi:hypothetical protein